ncbi:MAG: choice-of-anchor tandem repeat GloVer-containing protein [Candidatus Cybelea sp.]
MNPLKKSPSIGACIAAAFLASCSGSQPPIGASQAMQHSLARPGATGTVLHSFAGGTADGSLPVSGLTKAGDVLYGTTSKGGSTDGGTIYSISPDGTGFALLHSFKGAVDGKGSAASLLNVNGTLYGTNPEGGASGNGTVFSITPAGAFKTLYSFKGGSADGARPLARLTNVGGTLYGTTQSGGNIGSCSTCGTVFSISTSGKEKVLYFFGSKKDDGISPESALVNVSGKLYGTTTNGGNGGIDGHGTIFSVTTGGTETVLYKFKNTADGSCSSGCYLTKLGGTLYGTAHDGGKNKNGSVFSITPGGTFKTLYSVPTGGKAAGKPRAALTDAAGTLYGTMSLGPLDKKGTVFSVTTDGTLKVIYKFAGGSEGALPWASLILVDTTLFGTTAEGGSENHGTIYSIAGF